MVSPAAKTSSCPATRNVSSTVRKPLASSGNPAVRQPARRRRLRGPQNLVGLDRRVAVEHQPSGLDAGDRRARDDGDAARGENGVEARAERRRKARQDVGHVGDEDERQAARHRSRRARPRARSRRSTESSSSTPPAPAPTSATRARPLRASTRAMSASNRREEAVDRLDRNGVLARARHIRGVRRRADIEREQIVRHRRAVAADHATRRRDRGRRPRPDRAARRQSAPADRCRYGRRRTRNGRR